MKKVVAISAIALGLTGCMSYGEYYASVDASNARAVEAQKATAEADAMRYQALMAIAASGDETAKVAATMALALGGQTRPTQMAIPTQPQNEALQWASVLAPVVSQGLSLHYNTRMGIRQSDNATRLGINTNQTFGQFASEINNPVIVEQPAPIIVDQPAPIVVEQPAPIVIDQPAPVIVEQPAPIVIDPPTPIIIEPVIVEQPAPIIIEPVAAP